MKYSHIYPMFLWLSTGFKQYMLDPWNTLEFTSYGLFVIACGSKIFMAFLASPMKDEYETVLRGETDSMGSTMSLFTATDSLYMGTLALNAPMMCFQMFKYIDVIPQLGLLIMVLKRAAGPVCVFSLVAMIPVIGMAMAFHVAYAQKLQNYSTWGKSLNTVMRMSVGLFDYDEVELARMGDWFPTTVLLFWFSTLLIVFVLVNIFIAIILGAYNEVVVENEEAADVSDFVSTVMVQVKKTAAEAASGTALSELAGCVSI